MGTLLSDMQLWRRKFERNLQDHGLGTALTKSFAYVWKILYQHSAYRLYKINLRDEETELPFEVERVEFRFIDERDENAVAEIEDNSEWLSGTLKQRLTSGALCLAAFENGRLAGFNLVSFGDVFMPLVNLSRTFRRDEAWSEQIATVKSFRKKGLASQLRYRVFEELRRRGIRKFYGGALTDNVASLRLARRVGFHEFVEVRYTRVLQFQKWQYVKVQNESA
jgi:GNAT superfamily N-acetyltransferase